MTIDRFIAEKHTNHQREDTQPTAQAAPQQPDEEFYKTVESPAKPGAGKAYPSNAVMPLPPRPNMQADEQSEGELYETIDETFNRVRPGVVKSHTTDATPPAQ